MTIKIFLPVLLIAGSSLQLAAQKPIRKGSISMQPSRKGPVAKYSLKQLEGKWQEVKRVPAGGKETIAFADSLVFNFQNGKVDVKDVISMRMSETGEAQVDAPNTLIAAGDIYGIKSLDKNTLIIEDAEFTRELQKKELFYFETVGKIKVERDSFATPVNIDINLLKGKWLVYSRQAAPGATNPQTALIKSLEIISISEDKIAFGEISFYTADITNTSSCQLVAKDGSIKIIAGKNSWNFYAYKADANEFVFGETGKLVYYSKKL